MSGRYVRCRARNLRSPGGKRSIPSVNPREVATGWLQSPAAQAERRIDCTRARSSARGQMRNRRGLDRSRRANHERQTPRDRCGGSAEAREARAPAHRA